MPAMTEGIASTDIKKNSHAGGCHRGYGSRAFGGPAALAGVRVGDLIVALDDTPITGADDLNRLLGVDRIGRSTNLKLIRNGGLEILSVTPRER